MKTMIFYGYEFLAGFLPFLVILGFTLHLQKKRGRSCPRGYAAAAIVFSMYLIAVLHFTGSGTLYDALAYRLSFRGDHLNLIPFSEEIAIIPYLLNILLFVPLGFLAPLIWKKMNRAVSVAVLSFSFSLLIELSQLLNNRRPDIDDLILNTLGGILGFLLFQSLPLSRPKNVPGKLPSAFSGVTVYAYILVVFLGRFFLYNEIGVAGMLYSF